MGVCLVRRIRRRRRERAENDGKKKTGEALIKNLAADKIKSIAAAAESGDWRGAAPVHLWNPPFCGDIDIEIRTNTDIDIDMDPDPDQDLDLGT